MKKATDPRAGYERVPVCQESWQNKIVLILLQKAAAAFNPLRIKNITEGAFLESNRCKETVSSETRFSAEKKQIYREVLARPRAYTTKWAECFAPS